MSEISETQMDAAEKFSAATIQLLQDERGVHAETAIAAAARMAGTFLFRSFNSPLDDATPGQPVLSEQANEQGPRLMQILVGVLEQIGIVVDQEVISQPTDPEHEPLLGFLDTQKKLEPEFAAIRESFGLSLGEAAEAVAIATAMLIRQCTEVLDPSVAFGIALYGFVQGTKTYPAPLS